MLALPAETNTGGVTDPDYLESVKGKAVATGSLIKLLELSGIRVVPIHYKLPKPQIKALFQKVNGIFFQGGYQDYYDSDGARAEYTEASRYLFQLVKETNDRGVYTPLFGICLGLQYLHNIVVDEDVLVSHETSYMQRKMYLTEKGKTSRLFSQVENLTEFEDRSINFHVHHWAIDLETYQKHPDLKEFYNILALAHDGNGEPIVAAVEAKKYPIYAI